MATKTTAINYSRKFLNACKELPIKIDRAVLFGSVVQGTTSSASDIDLALYSDNFSNDILKNIDLLGKVLIRFPELDIHTFPARKQKKNSIMEEEIKQTGIEIKL